MIDNSLRDRAYNWFRGRREARTQGWRRTDALVRAVVCGLGLLVAGMVAHRLELVLIGMPLVIGVLVTKPPTGTPTVVSQPRPDTTGRESRVAVAVTPGEGAVFTALRMPMPATPGIGRVHLLPAVTGEVGTLVRWQAWGHGVYLRPDYLFASHDALYVFGPVVGVAAHRTVLPPVEPLAPGPLPPRAAGLVGAHRAIRPGDGMELRDIRPFQPGDRLRRVDWRVSLRAAAATGGTLEPRTLHVRERHAETDADLVLALDTRFDLSSAVAEWNEHTPGADVRPGGSLDIGVRATSTLAATFLRHGDRVGFVDVGHPMAGVPIGAGHRQLQRIRYQLAHSARRVGLSGGPVLRPAQLPHGATVVVLSPFLDDKLVELVLRAARRDRLMVAVDLLPPELDADPESRWGQPVVSILRTEHRLRLRALAEHGVAVVPWDGGAQLNALLGAARRRRWT